MISHSVLLVLSMGLNIYLVLKVVRSKSRCMRCVTILRNLAFEGKIDAADVNDAADSAKARREMERDVERPLYGGD